MFLRVCEYGCTVILIIDNWLFCELCLMWFAYGCVLMWDLWPFFFFWKGAASASKVLVPPALKSFSWFSRLKQYQESRSGCWNCFPKDHSVTYLKVVDMKFACIRFHSWRVYGLKVTHQMVYIWDTTSRHILYKLLGHIGSVNECVFHPSEPNVGACN